MANWLTKIMQATTPSNQATSQQLPAKTNPKLTPAKKTYIATEPVKLPNASVIYGIAASILGVVALSFFLRGMWFTGLLVLLVAACFLGFAVHFLRHPHS